MSNKVKDIGIKNHMYYFLNDIINIKISYLLHWICHDKRFEIHKN